MDLSNHLNKGRRQPGYPAQRFTPYPPRIYVPTQSCAPMSKPFQCQICEKYFSSVPSRQYHIDTIHNLDYQKLLCPLCKAKPDRTNLGRHINSIHRRLKPWGCGKCDQMFTHGFMRNKHASKCEGNGTRNNWREDVGEKDWGSYVKECLGESEESEEISTIGHPIASPERPRKSRVQHRGEMEKRDADNQPSRTQHPRDNLHDYLKFFRPSSGRYPGAKALGDGNLSSNPEQLRSLKKLARHMIGEYSTPPPQIRSRTPR